MNKIILLSLIAFNALMVVMMFAYLDQPFYNESDICPIIEYRYTLDVWNPDMVSFTVSWVITLITDLILSFYILGYHGGNK